MSLNFCANEPTLGYLYQIRYGMKLLLDQENDNAVLLIENIDDISIQSGSNLDLYQTKFHLNNPPNIANASSDFWKTIRVWSEKIKSNQLSAGDCVFTIMTTAAASPGSILENLRYDKIKGRDIDGIIASMINVINNSTSTTNKASYDAFVALDVDQKKQLVERIVLADSSEDINKAKDGIIRHLRIVSQNFNPLFDRLEGWFLGQVILQLQNLRGGITYKEMQQTIWDIADSLKSDNLPADFLSSIAGDENQLLPYRDRMFVKQLELVKVNPAVINNAISDYHRAFSQSSRWIRDGLISAADQMVYQEKLIDDWSRKFAAVCSPVPGEDSSKAEERGRSFYQNFYVLQYPTIHIKDRFKEAYMVTGSCQMLSNDKKIGWHPEYGTLV